MFKDDTFTEWLNIQASKSMELINNNDISKEDRNFHMLVIMLKAQTNHFEHLDEDLRNDMKSVKQDIHDLRSDFNELREDMNALREDMNTQNRVLREEMNKQNKELREEMNTQNKELREEMNRGFIEMYRHMNRAIIAMFGITLTIASIATAIIKFL